MNEPTDQQTPFIAFRRFNDPALSQLTRLKTRIDARAEAYFTSDSLADRLVRALAVRRALPIKEVFESFEFFERTRRRLRAPQMVDLCCGHGLTGILFAIFSRKVEGVTLVDRRKPVSHALIHEAAVEVAPWVKDKVRYLEQPLSAGTVNMPAAASVIAVHACGKRTDRCLDLAVALGGKVAVMPCCYFQTAHAVPPAVVQALGSELATDVHRSYGLEGRGYSVQWSAIPEAVTPKRRILIGLPPGAD